MASEPITPDMPPQGPIDDPVPTPMDPIPPTPSDPVVGGSDPTDHPGNPFTEGP